MESNKEEYEATTKLLDAAYKNTRMASYAIDCIIDKIKDPKLEELLRKQNDFYLDTTEEIEKMSEELKHKPVDINIFLKGTSFASINMKTMMDGSSEHIAEMLVQGTTMGITDMIKSQGEFKVNNKKLEKITNSIVASEEKFVESLKDFL